MYIDLSRSRYELDTQKMPLGKISAATIKSGYAILKEIEALLDEAKITGGAE